MGIACTDQDRLPGHGIKSYPKIYSEISSPKIIAVTIWDLQVISSPVKKSAGCTELLLGRVFLGIVRSGHIEITCIFVFVFELDLVFIWGGVISIGVIYITSRIFIFYEPFSRIVGVFLGHGGSISGIYGLFSHNPKVGSGIKVKHISEVIVYIGSNTFRSDHITSLNAIRNRSISAVIYIKSNLSGLRRIPVVCLIFGRRSIIKKACSWACFIKIFGYVSCCSLCKSLCACGRP